MKITCSKNVGGPCNRDAATILLIRNYDGASWTAKGRCAFHGPAEDVRLLGKVWPKVHVMVLPVPAEVTA